MSHELSRSTAIIRVLALVAAAPTVFVGCIPRGRTPDLAQRCDEVRSAPLEIVERRLGTDLASALMGSAYYELSLTWDEASAEQRCHLACELAQAEASGGPGYGVELELDILWILVVSAMELYGTVLYFGTEAWTVTCQGRLIEAIGCWSDEP